MAGNNPIFQRIEKDMRSGYAGFGAAQHQQVPQDRVTPMSPQQLDDLYTSPSATQVQAGRVTFDDVIMKALGLFTLVVVVAGATWVYTRSIAPALTMPAMWGGMIGTLVLGFVIAFKKTISVPLILTYAVLEGLFVGAISMVLEQVYPGIVATAVLATVCTFAGMFVGYRTGLVKVTSRTRRIFAFAAMGYFLFSLVNVFTQAVGWTQGWGIGDSSGLGVVISVIGVGLASYSLAVDFDSIDQGVRAGLPQKYSWLFAHGLIVSLVWLYIEILRLLARFRD
ncbi:MAG: Bax inhibitor-1/YccA family protein [Candidatus Lutibacillus vidarii]|nr:Bax inhibitor-1/YccA family protein [Dermatophilaceae bacterium]